MRKIVIDSETSGQSTCSRSPYFRQIYKVFTTIQERESTTTFLTQHTGTI